MMDYSMKPEVRARREREFAETSTRAELEALQIRWGHEDRAAEAVGTLQARQLDDLARRVARLERFVNPKGGGLMKAIGQALGMVRADIDKKIAEVAKQQMRFAGIYESGRTYEPNTLVIKRGSLWISLDRTCEAPGSASWQLCTKQGEAGKTPGVA